jgi:hypothetical protein
MQEEEEEEEDSMLRSEVRKLINFIWNKEELPQEWK